MSWDGGQSRSGAVIVGFRNGDRIARVSPDRYIKGYIQLGMSPDIFWFPTMLDNGV